MNAPAPLPPPPPPTKCITGGCDGEAQPMQTIRGGKRVWRPGLLCPACEASRNPIPKSAAVAQLPLPAIAACARCQAPLEPGSGICGSCRAALDAERLESERQARQALSGLPARYGGFHFGQVLVQDSDEAMPAFVARVEQAGPVGARPLGICRHNAQVARVLADWTPGPQGLFLTGPVGGGKTTLAAAALNSLIRKGVEVLYLPEAQLYQQMRGQGGDRRMRQDLPTLASRVPVLALDDLGTVEGLAPWQLNVLETVVGTRYERGLPILVTTNLRLGDLARLSERMASRLAEMSGRVQHELVGFDWRTGTPHARTFSP